MNNRKDTIHDIKEQVTLNSEDSEEGKDQFYDTVEDLPSQLQKTVPPPSSPARLTEKDYPPGWAPLIRAPSSLGASSRSSPSPTATTVADSYTIPPPPLPQRPTIAITRAEGGHPNLFSGPFSLDRQSRSQSMDSSPSTRTNKSPSHSSLSSLEVCKYETREMDKSPPSPRLSHYQAPSTKNIHPLAELDKVNNDGGANSFMHVLKSSASSTSTLTTTTTTTTTTRTETKSSPSIKSIMMEKTLPEGASRPVPVRVRCRRKMKLELEDLLLIQTLYTSDSTFKNRQSNNNNAIYGLEFSHDGNFMAVAGENGKIHIWKSIISSPWSFDDQMNLPGDDEKSFLQNQESKVERKGEIFVPQPLQILIGHERAVLDLSWSKNNFLLSASLDKTVRLWHPSRSDCLGVFHHPDFVTSVAFHPRDDRVFISGSLDCRLRLWSIAERNVKAWHELPTSNFITAVAFNHSGKLVLAGTSTGVCLVFETEGFTYSTQIHVRSRRGKNKLGRKVCGIEAMPGNSGDEKILISTNDSRIRLYTLRDKSLVSKFIGHHNEHGQIRATFSDDGEYIVSGSEDGRIYIWNTEGHYTKRRLFTLPWRRNSRHMKACEWITAHSTTTGVVRVAPSIMKYRLQAMNQRPVTGQEGEGEGEMAQGMIIAAGDQNGTIKVYENNRLLLGWLDE